MSEAVAETVPFFHKKNDTCAGDDFFSGSFQLFEQPTLQRHFGESGGPTSSEAARTWTELLFRTRRTSSLRERSAESVAALQKGTFKT